MQSPNSTRLKHINNGKCLKCKELFDKYAGFHVGLRAFFEAFQMKNPDGHISCAGRGEELQNKYFKIGASRARYGESAHNYNAAFDVFRQTPTGLSYDSNWFKMTLGNAVAIFNTKSKDFKINWYGAPGTKFFELPHCEVEAWKTLNLDLVEPKKEKAPA